MMGPVVDEMSDKFREKLNLEKSMLKIIRKLPLNLVYFQFLILYYSRWESCKPVCGGMSAEDFEGRLRELFNSETIIFLYSYNSDNMVYSSNLLKLENQRRTA